MNPITVFCHVCQAPREKHGITSISSPAAQVVDGRTLPVSACDTHTQAEIKAAHANRYPAPTLYDAAVAAQARRDETSEQKPLA